MLSGTGRAPRNGRPSPGSDSVYDRPGRQAGEFTALHNIAADHQGNIFTAEVNTGQRVQKFRRLDQQD